MEQRINLLDESGFSGALEVESQLGLRNFKRAFVRVVMNMKTESVGWRRVAC